MGIRFDFLSPPSLPLSFSVPILSSLNDLNKFPKVVPLSNAAVFMLSRVTARYARRHVKITFDLLQSREKKAGSRWTSLYVTVSATCFVSESGERTPTLRTGGQLIRLAERFITTSRLSGCQFRSGDGSNVVFRAVGVAACVFAVAACPLRSRDTGRTARNLAWNYSPEIKFRPSYLWKRHWLNETLF